MPFVADWLEQSHTQNGKLTVPEEIFAEVRLESMTAPISKEVLLAVSK